VPKTLLAVDDSATMRKVLEITFAGEDFRVVTADGTSSALARMGEEPAAAVIDTSLDGDDGYALAKEVRARGPRLAIVLMASRNNPYDPGRGRDAGADDYVDKPFDTQALIDKVKKALAARETAVAAPVAAAPPPHVPAAAVPLAPPMSTSPRPPVAASRAPWNPRSHTLSFEGRPPGMPVGPPAAQPHAPAPPPHAPPPHAPPPHAPAPQAPSISRTAPAGVPIAPPPTAHPAPPPPPMHTAPTAAPPRAPEPSPVAASVNGQLAGKLGELGLTPQQADAVLALSREVVERIVWEVVPQLAETMIKEELARLTKDG